MLSQRIQFSGKLEGVEGVIETLAAADAKTLVYGPKFKLDPEKFDSDPARYSGAAQKQLIGKVPGKISGQVRMRGPKGQVVTTDPDWVKYIQACGMSTSLLKSIAIGAITGGPFLHNEVITGAGGAQGRVVFRTVTGASVVYYTSVGTLEFSSGETITGATSGATATTGAVPANAGRCWKPILDNVPCLSMGFNQDGYFEQLKGARGNAKFSITGGKPGLWDLDFSGVDGGQSDEVFFEGVAYEDNEPPLLLDADILLDAYAPKLHSLDFDLGVQLAMREDPTDSKGILSYGLTGRKITGTIVLEMVLAAAYDFRAKYLAGTEAILDVAWGTSPNRFRIYKHRIQILDIDKGDKDKLTTVSLQYQANGSLDQDDDMVMVQL